MSRRMGECHYHLLTHLNICYNVEAASLQFSDNAAGIISVVGGKGREGEREREYQFYKQYRK